MPEAIACTVCGDPLRTNEIEDRVCKECGTEENDDLAAGIPFDELCWEQSV